MFKIDSAKVMIVIAVFSVLLCGNIFAEYQDVVVYDEPGIFCGWPANEGVWSWGDEILVGFNVAVYESHDDAHNYDPNFPIETIQARSLDGGVTWQVERPEPFGLDVKYQEPHNAINFTHPDFAMKLRNRKLFYSYDRGKKWEGPFLMPKFDQVFVRARTDYIIESQSCAKMFLSVSRPDGIDGRTLTVETRNGGRTFDMLGWVTPDPEMLKDTHSYALMPSTVKLAENTYLSAIRCRVARRKWIDIYKTTDGGKNWTLLNTAVEGQWNPASMIKLSDGRIALTYGWRGVPQGIRAKISDDDGQSWSDEIILRDDGNIWDLGYPRTVQRSDGKIVTIYYYATDEMPQQYIGATIWQP
ncbi:MAG: sialidase family protein [Sedimentisphaeraceae bacterium JB056]